MKPIKDKYTAFTLSQTFNYGRNSFVNSDYSNYFVFCNDVPSNLFWMRIPVFYQKEFESYCLLNEIWFIHLENTVTASNVDIQRKQIVENYNIPQDTI